MSVNNKVATGIFILSAGIIILLGKWGFFSLLWHALWPLLLLVPGILLHLWFFYRRGSAMLLLPGGVLVVYSIILFVGIIGGWKTLAYIWPGFILGIAVGLYEYCRFSPRTDQGLLITALVLGIVSIVLLSLSLSSWSVIYLLAILLIAGGIWLIASRNHSWGNSRRKW